MHARSPLSSYLVSAAGALALVLPSPVSEPAAAAPQPPAVEEPAEGTRTAVREVPVVADVRARGIGWVAMTQPEQVTGYGLVGATWAGAAPAGLAIAVRTSTDGAWTPWVPLDSDHEVHDPAAPTAQRRGTAPFVAGEVDLVQLRAEASSGTAPRGLRLSIVDPGRQPVDRKADTPPAMALVARSTPRKPGVRAPRPVILKRADWGADRRLRTGQPRYGRVKAAFVHHTVNSNRYRRGDVPAIIRGIYAYHTRSLGWSDIGYNFVVDRFGRTWVGRAGGARQPVVGAQVYGYNHVSTGIAVIGNFEEVRPGRKVLRALGRTLGWKLGLAGIAAGERTRMKRRPYFAVNGHRDAGQTACPGRYLYDRLPGVRTRAVRWQRR